MPCNALTPAQRRALLMFRRTGGVLALFAEDTIGCRGAAMWAVIDALVRKGCVSDPEGNGNLFEVTQSGLQALAA